MTSVTEATGSYLTTFSEFEGQQAGREPSWVGRVRHEAIDRFADLGFPTTKLEDWKYTNVAPLASVAFQQQDKLRLPENLSDVLRTLPLADMNGPKLVFVNGIFVGDHSQLAGLPSGVRVRGLSDALAAGEPQLERHLARYAQFQDHAFVALNTAFMRDGAFIEVGKNVVVEAPIHLLYVSLGDLHPAGQPEISHPRNLILAGRGSQVNILEHYLSLSNGGYLTNTVTEIVADDDATVDFFKVNQESRSAFHVATIQAYQERASVVHTNSIQLGGALVREEVNPVLDGEGAECLLYGLYVTSGRQHVDNHTKIDHAKPHCGSREIYKGVLDDQSTGVFSGKIIVRKDAQKTDSKQSNKNLLLSEDAVINTKPQLEIYADDVKCTHGATIGQIEPEAVFYLRSRGIGLDEARAMLTLAFANDVVDKIKYAPLRERLESVVLERLAK